MFTWWRDRWGFAGTSLVLLAACAGPSGPPSECYRNGIGLTGAVNPGQSIYAAPLPGDRDGDGLSDAQEARHGTNPELANTDLDDFWDGEEITMFGSDPLNADSDGDGIRDGADAQPLRINNATRDPGSGLCQEHGVFNDNDRGTARMRIRATRYQENHVVYVPGGGARPLLLYQTYVNDSNGDGVFDEGDLTGSVVAVMNGDGSRPRFLTDRDAETGLVRDNGAVDATPEPSPDGRHFFVSDRHKPGSFQLKLYVMDRDGRNPVAVRYAENAPGASELDADPEWGPGNMLTFKRQKFQHNRPLFSRVYTARIDPATMTLHDVQERTNGESTRMRTPNGPGDFDPKFSPDGRLIASYRHLSDKVIFFGDYDVWVGPAEGDGAIAVTILTPDDGVADLFPRWNVTGDKLAAWQLDGRAAAAGRDAIDIVVFDLKIGRAPFSVTATKRNITADKDGWFETMPSWQTDPDQADSLVYSGSRNY